MTRSLNEGFAIKMISNNKIIFSNNTAFVKACGKDVERETKLIIVLDVSGSMEGNIEPLLARFNQTFGKDVTTIYFSSDAWTQDRLQYPSDGRAFCSTHMAPAVRELRKQLKRLPSDCKPVVLFVSDGDIWDSDDTFRELERCEEIKRFDALDATMFVVGREFAKFIADNIGKLNVNPSGLVKPIYGGRDWKYNMDDMMNDILDSLKETTQVELVCSQLPCFPQTKQNVQNNKWVFVTEPVQVTSPVSRRAAKKIVQELVDSIVSRVAMLPPAESENKKLSDWVQNQDIFDDDQKRRIKNQCEVDTSSMGIEERLKYISTITAPSESMSRRLEKRKNRQMQDDIDYFNKACAEIEIFADCADSQSSLSATSVLTLESISDVLQEVGEEPIEASSLGELISCLSIPGITALRKNMAGILMEPFLVRYYDVNDIVVDSANVAKTLSTAAGYSNSRFGSVIANYGHNTELNSMVPLFSGIPASFKKAVNSKIFQAVVGCSLGMYAPSAPIDSTSAEIAPPTTNAHLAALFGITNHLLNKKNTKLSEERKARLIAAIRDTASMYTLPIIDEEYIRDPTNILAKSVFFWWLQGGSPAMASVFFDELNKRHKDYGYTSFILQKGEAEIQLRKQRNPLEFVNINKYKKYSLGNVLKRQKGIVGILGAENGALHVVEKGDPSSKFVPNCIFKYYTTTTNLTIAELENFLGCKCTFEIAKKHPINIGPIATSIRQGDNTSHGARGLLELIDITKASAVDTLKAEWMGAYSEIHAGLPQLKDVEELGTLVPKIKFNKYGIATNACMHPQCPHYGVVCGGIIQNHILDTVTAFHKTAFERRRGDIDSALADAMSGALVYKKDKMGKDYQMSHLDDKFSDEVINQFVRVKGRYQETCGEICAAE